MPRRIAALCAALAAPGAALAHSPIEGIEGFYVGLLHPLSTAPQLLALIALGLVLAQDWPENYGRKLSVFSGSLALGILAGQFGLSPDPMPPILLGVALACAVVAALVPSAPAVLGPVAAAVTGALVGVLSTPDPGPVRATAITLAGSFVGASLAVLYATGGIGWLRERFPQDWMRIGTRVAAAWVAAITALMLALQIAAPQA